MRVPYDYIISKNGNDSYSSSSMGKINKIESINSVLDTLTTGGNIYLGPGTYSENIEINNVKINLAANQNTILNGDLSINAWGADITNLRSTGNLVVNSHDLKVSSCSFTNAGLISDISSIYRVYFAFCKFNNGEIVITSKSNNFVNDIVFENCYFNNSPVVMNSEYPATGSAHRVFNSCYFFSQFDYAITTTSSQDDKVNNCHFDGMSIHASGDVYSLFLLNSSFNSTGIVDLTAGAVFITQCYKFTGGSEDQTRIPL